MKLEDCLKILLKVPLFIQKQNGKERSEIASINCYDKCYQSVLSV